MATLECARDAGSSAHKDSEMRMTPSRRVARGVGVTQYGEQQRRNPEDRRQWKRPVSQKKFKSPVRRLHGSD